ncbi:MAG: glycosyltransferase family 2 protein [Patescibacteria group bacterium]
MYKPVYSVLIVSWQVRDYLRLCLRALARQLKDAAVEVIVVDNASSDGSAQMVEREFEWVRLIKANRNLGFAAATNMAAAAASGDYFVLLNPDTVVGDSFFSALADFFRNHPTAGVVGGKIINPDGTLQPSVRRFPDLLSQTLVSLKLSHFFPGLFSKYLATDFDYNQEAKVDQVMGACFIVPKDVWQNLGGFDANFFVWFEEVDFCRRLKDDNGEIWYSPQITVQHQPRSSARQLTAFRRHYIYSRSLVYYFCKHKSTLAGLILVLAAAPWLIISYVVQVFQPKFPHS